jgi:pyruvate/2-oxoglutarate dehydrogenase complex dihydrolipoamide acyltransferase (E2) component
MSNELEGRVDRLERALAQGHGVNLAEYDSPEQAAARAKQLEADQKDADEQTAAAEAEAAAPAETEPPEDVEVTDAAWAKAEELGVDINTVTGTGADGRITVADVEAAAKEAGN